MAKHSERTKTTAVAYLMLVMFAMAYANENICPAKADFSNVVFPWTVRNKDGVVTWPAVEVYWRYEMQIEVVVFNESAHYVEAGLQRINVKVDGLAQKARQDVYMKFNKDRETGKPLHDDNGWRLKHVVIADYRHSTILDNLHDDATGAQDCEVLLFDKSLNLISNLILEMWLPKQDSYTTYIGRQSTKLAQGQSFHVFKTISSDDVEWSVFFNEETGLPQFAISERYITKGEDDEEKVHPSQTVIIKSYRPRGSFAEEEFMPAACFNQRQSRKVEGPIMPLADFGLVF